jgi:hypothetical protein
LRIDIVEEEKEKRETHEQYNSEREGEADDDTTATVAL